MKERYILKEEKEKHFAYKCIYDREDERNLYNEFSVLDRLNQQDKKIKELEERIESLKTSKLHFKKIAENVIDLLAGLNKFIGSPQKQKLNCYKVIEDTKNHIEQLKQSQKKLSELKQRFAINQFERMCIKLVEEKKNEKNI